MVHVASNANMIQGFRPDTLAPSVSHLQFADDMLIFCRADKEQIKNVKAILLCFEAVSGMKINFFKSEILGVSIEEPALSHYADILGCNVGSFPSILLYLIALGGPK